QMKRIEVGMSPSTMRVIDLSKDAAPPDTGKFDPMYRPTPAFAGMIRYKGFDILEGIFSEVTDFTFIVSKEIQNNRSQGKIFNRSAGPEGGGTSSYFCRTKDKPMAVDTSRRARFACNLKLTCTHDNPPGDTCLDSAFINQNTANGATMKQKF